jgi:hypothetical protein
MEVLSYRPEPAGLAWTFGGVPPVGVQWVGEAWGQDRLDAYQLLTQAAELYGGMHDRLRQLGRDHLASGGTGPR